MENKVLAVITPDTILQRRLYSGCPKRKDSAITFSRRKKADSAEAPAFDIGMGYLGKRSYRLEQSR